MKEGPIVIQDQTEDLLKDAAKVLAQRVESGHYSESMAVLALTKKPEE